MKSIAKRSLILGRDASNCWKNIFKNLKIILVELFEKRCEMITQRRSALLELMEIWEKANENRQFSRHVKNKDIELKIVQDTDRDSIDKNDNREIEQEKEFMARMKNFIPIQLSENTLLKDGRYVGEQRLLSVGLLYSLSKPEQKEHEKRYFVRLSFPDQASSVETEILGAYDFTQILKSKRTLSSLLPPNYLVDDSPSSYQIVMADKTLNSMDFIPMLSVYEVPKSSSSLKEEKLLGEA